MQKLSDAELQAKTGEFRSASTTARTSTTS